MLRDRLRQIKPLMSPDGSVWVHLDDVEVHRCRSVMDEELGAENFVSEVIWQKAMSPRNDATQFSSDHDTILVYAANSGWRSNRLPRLASRDALYKSTDGDPRRWISDNPAAPGTGKGRQHPGVYGIQNPITGDMIYPARGRHWTLSQDRMFAILCESAPYRLVPPDAIALAQRSERSGVPIDSLREDVADLRLALPLEQSSAIAQERYAQGCWPRVYFTHSGRGGLKAKVYLDEVSDSRAPRTMWFHSEVGHSRSAKHEISDLFPQQSAFATPKPERLIQRIIFVASNPGDVVLDCFAGSGTTAAVAHKMGRRWVASELLADTVEQFIRPRLTKVVYGQDPGGVTAVTERVADRELPDSVQPEQADEFARLLRKFKKFLGDQDEAPELDAVTVKALLDAAKTRPSQTKLWHGGGGFTHLRVGPSMFEKVGDLVLLAPWATQGDLARAMCAQLSVPYKPDGIFAGSVGGTRYVVIDGMAGDGTVDAVLDQLLEGELVEIWATQVDPDAIERLRKARPGCRLAPIPAAVLDRYRHSAAVAKPFGGPSSRPESSDPDRARSDRARSDGEGARRG